MNIGIEDDYISIFREEAPGDYSITYIFPDKNSSYTHYRHHLMENRAGKLPEEVVNRMFKHVAESGFFKLREEYKPINIPFIGREDGELSYTITVSMEGKKISVTAFQGAIPDIFRELVLLVSNSTSYMSDVGLDGTLIRASRMNIRLIPFGRVSSNRQSELEFKRNYPVYYINSSYQLREVAFLFDSVSMPEKFVRVDGVMKDHLDMLRGDNSKFYVNYLGTYLLVKVYENKSIFESRSLNS